MASCKKWKLLKNFSIKDLTLQKCARLVFALMLEGIDRIPMGLIGRDQACSLALTHAYRIT
jgi:hypothetical protein